MAKYSDVSELEEQLAEALARIESLQTSAADAEARYATARAELKAATDAQSEVLARLEFGGGGAGRGAGPDR